MLRYIIGIIIIVLLITSIVVCCSGKEGFKPLLDGNKSDYVAGIQISKVNTNSLRAKNKLEVGEGVTLTNCSEYSNNYKTISNSKSTDISSKNLTIGDIEFAGFDNDTKLQLINMLYPVGSIYITCTAGSLSKPPFDVGNWEVVWKNMYLFSAVKDAWKPDTQITEQTDKLTLETLPSHTHGLQEMKTDKQGTAHSHKYYVPGAPDYDVKNVGFDYSYWTTMIAYGGGRGAATGHSKLGTKDIDGVLLSDWTQYSRDMDSGKAGDYHDYKYTSTEDAFNDETKLLTTNMSGGHKHKVQTNNSDNTTGDVNFPELTVSERTFSGSEPFLQPYICVCMWKRLE